VRRVIEAVWPEGWTASPPAAVVTMGPPAARLLAAMTTGGQIAAWIRIPDKTDEIGCFRDLLGPLDLEGVVVRC
jgi:hypothetical protein